LTNLREKGETGRTEGGREGGKEGERLGGRKLGKEGRREEFFVTGRPSLRRPEDNFRR
jgi:hypothetical protein